jgi:hypothetical protein
MERSRLRFASSCRPSHRGSDRRRPAPREPGPRPAGPKAYPDTAVPFRAGIASSVAQVQFGASILPRRLPFASSCELPACLPQAQGGTGPRRRLVIRPIQSPPALAPRHLDTTASAHSTYPALRSCDQSLGGLDPTSRRLQILSAILSSLPRGDVPAACSICSRFRTSFGSVLSSDTSPTSALTSAPNRSSSSSGIVGVSSTVSCRIAATSNSSSVT